MPVWLQGVAIVLVAVAAVAVFRRVADRLAARALLRHRARIDRFKLASRAHVRDRLLRDPAILAAVREHAREHGTSEQAALKRARAYVDEIVPFFNVIAYFQIGYRISRAALNLF
jgi:glycerol-3-phosphate O-acyltransferase